jgi:acyl-CoA dehydrogenase
MNFASSDKVKGLQERLTAFMEEHIYPNEPRYHEHGRGPNRWLPVLVIEELKSKAREAGFWNLFLPESESGAGLTKRFRMCAPEPIRGWGGRGFE